ncbi:MAG: helix-turn-helix domain-containing protein [Syntrophobacterales bacterium]|jgi:transposase|nr:helix-turn-helix domain-containing protein [Syntrophobacterales bacterium]
MRSLTLSHPSLTRESLLRKADEIPGAWVGIRIAALLLMLCGWKSTQVAEVFGLTRWSVVKWIHKANSQGVEAVSDRARPGRPPRVGRDILKKLDEALSKSPREFGISKTKWDGAVVTEFLKKAYGIHVHIRHAQRLMEKLGYSLRRPVYRYVQAKKSVAKEFLETLKKSPDGAEEQG